jgi:VanZ family protein
VLTAYAVGWCLVNLAPFDITVDPGDLADRVRSGQIALLPFRGPDLFSPRWTWDALAETLSAVPLGLFGWRAGRSRGAPAAFAVAMAIVVVVEAAQVFISSHAATTTDVLFAGLGAAAGVSLGRRFVAGGRLAGASPRRTVNWYALAALVAWVGVLGAYHWLPYDFAFDKDAIEDKLGRMSLLPFAGYRGGSYLNALNNLLTKLALSAPIGLAASFVLPSSQARRPIVVVGWFIVGAAIFAGIEFGQLFVPTRLPDPTDVLVGVTGVVAGLRVGSWLRSPEPAPGKVLRQEDI